MDAFLRAVVDRDGPALDAMGEAEPVGTLVRLDAAMRGLVFGFDPTTFEAMVSADPARGRWLRWVLEQDRSLRTRVGWTQREADLAILRGAYRAGDLALVVGAGVSMAAGMPGWDDLALELVRRALRHGTSEHRLELHERLRASSMEGLEQHLTPANPKTRSWLQWAERELEGQPADRSAALRGAGEAVLAVYGDRLFDELRDVLFTRTLRRAAIHPAIAAMVRSPDTSAPRTPRVFQILTYNFDDLLESAIREAGRESRAFFSQAGQSDPDGLRPGRPLGDVSRPSAVDIYHLHGFVPSPRDAYAFAPVQDVDLVFTDSQYRARYGDDSWITRVQRGMFGNAPNLFLGSSLEDQDAVRQLTSVHERRPGWFNFAVLQLPEQARPGRERLGGQDLDDLGRRYREMGIRVLWIAEFDELPGLLASIADPEVA